MVAYGIFGLAMIIVGEALSFIHILPWSQYVFLLFWYGAILLLDSINFRLHGSSLLFGRPREFLLMFPVSAGYWSLFEGYNLFIENWVYLNIPTDPAIAISTKLVSFATVIPALYETVDLFQGSFRHWKRLQMRPWLPSYYRALSGALGLILTILPLVAPRLFFWSVWVGPFLFIDAINDWLGRPSLLRQWRLGTLHRTARWLVSGYLCGFFWEFWNYWAYTKWVYTIPIWDMPRIFEMPVLGFFGFGPFALGTFAFWNLLWGQRDHRD